MNDRNPTAMKSRKPITIRSPGQRSFLSSFIYRPLCPCSTSTSNSKGGSIVPVQKNSLGSNLSLTDFLNRKLHSNTSVLPIHKDKDTFSLVKKDNFHPTAGLNPLEKSVAKEKKFDSKGAHDEKGCVIDESVFKLLNNSGEKVRKRSSEGITAASRFENVSKKQSQNHLLVLGDDPKPRNQREASYSYEKPRPVYNHYENGTGWWQPEREGVDGDEVWNSAMWEGVGSTTLGGLNWH